MVCWIHCTVSNVVASWSLTYFHHVKKWTSYKLIIQQPFSTAQKFIHVPKLLRSRDVIRLPFNQFPFLKSDTVYRISQTVSVLARHAIYCYHHHSYHLDSTTTACLISCSCPTINSPFPHGPMWVTLQQTETVIWHVDGFSWWSSHSPLGRPNWPWESCHISISDWRKASFPTVGKR